MGRRRIGPLNFISPSPRNLGNLGSMRRSTFAASTSNSLNIGFFATRDTKLRPLCQYYLSELCDRMTPADIDPPPLQGVSNSFQLSIVVNIWWWCCVRYSQRVYNPTSGNQVEQYLRQNSGKSSRFLVTGLNNSLTLVRQS